MPICLERYSTNTVWMPMSAQVLKRRLCLEKIEPDSSQRCSLIEEGAVEASCRLNIGEKTFTTIESSTETGY